MVVAQRLVEECKAIWMSAPQRIPFQNLDSMVQHDAVMVLKANVAIMNDRSKGSFVHKVKFETGNFSVGQTVRELVKATYDVRP